MAYKPYPSGVVLHALIDACLDSAKRSGRAKASSWPSNPLAVERTDRPEPRNALEARLSAHHAVAVAALRGRAGLAEFSDAAAIDPSFRRSAGACAWCRKSASTRWRPSSPQASP